MPHEQGVLPSDDLPGANWADRHHALSRRSGLSAGEAARAALGGKAPAWISTLMRFRNRIVGLFGLKPAELEAGGDRIGAFPIVSESPARMVLGFDDWHLDFRIVVETAAVANGTDVSVATLVKRKNWFGYAYIFLITPFHIMIVRRLLSNVKA